jgi:Tol biopolymer transport system component/DNA-binding winged helix-turn-helix (wHTH) protein
MQNKGFAKPHQGPPPQRAKAVFLFGPFRFDEAERVLMRDGEPVVLTPRAFDTLLALVSRAGRLVEKEQLLEEVWHDTFVEEKTLSQNVLTLRKALGRTPSGAHYIETVPKHGYRFAEPVRVLLPGVSARLLAKTHAPVELAIEEESESETEADATSAAQVYEATVPRASAETEIEPARDLFAQAATPSRRAAVRRLAAVAVLGVCVLSALVAALVIRQSGEPFLEFEVMRLTSSGDVGAIAISPDGRYAAYALVGAGRSRLLVRQVGSTSVVEVVPPDRVRYSGITFSKDGSHLYYVSRPNVAGLTYGDLYSMPIFGGTARKLIHDVDSPVAVAPDGRLTFVRVSADQKESALVIADAAGMNERRLAVRPGPDGFAPAGPAWSPDGRLIVCASNADPTRKWSALLLLVDAVDGSVKPFSQNRWSWIGRVEWAANGSGVFLVAWDNESPVMSDQLWFVSYPGDVPRRITNDVNGFLGASVSADSRAILAVRTQRVAGFFVSCLTGAEGGKRAGGVSADLFGERYGLSWTPDGKIVYGSSASGEPNIWVTDSEGASRRQLTSERGGNLLPSVSPDGNVVAFVSYRTGERHIWRINIDGSDPRQLTFGEGDNSPTFTPDGRWVVYSAYSEGRPTLWKVPASSGTPELLADLIADAPAVSPDGSLVACYHHLDPPAQPSIALVSFEGGRVVREFSPPHLITTSGVRWTPDGGALLYLAAGPGVSNLWLQPADGAPAKSLTNFNDDRIFRFDVSRDGRLIYERGTTVNDAILLRSK